jgi:hypothetical protein
MTDAEGEGDPREILINLNLAKELDSDLSGVRHWTKIIKFMVIKVLESRAYIY